MLPRCYGRLVLFCLSLDSSRRQACSPVSVQSGNGGQWAAAWTAFLPLLPALAQSSLEKRCLEQTNLEIAVLITGPACAGSCIALMQNSPSFTSATLLPPSAQAAGCTAQQLQSGSCLQVRHCSRYVCCRVCSSLSIDCRLAQVSACPCRCSGAHAGLYNEGCSSPPANSYDLTRS